MRWFQYRSTKQTVLVLVLLLFLVVSLISLLSYRVAANRLKYEATETHMALLSQIDHKMELVLQSIDQETIRMFDNKDVAAFFDADMNEEQSLNNAYRLNDYFAHFVNPEQYIYSIDLYSYARGKLFSGTGLKEDVSSANYDWIRRFAAFDGYSTWLPTRRLTLSNSDFPIYRNVVTLVRTYPLIHSPGYRRGAIAINIKEEELYHLLTDANHRSLGDTFMLDPNGLMVSNADKSRLGLDTSRDDSLARVLNGAQEGHFRTKIDSKLSSVFYVTSAFTGWKIVNVVPEIQLNRPLLNVRNALIVIAAALFVVAAVLAALVGLWTLKPVNRFAANLSKKLRSHPSYAGANWPNGANGNPFPLFEDAVQDILTDSERLQKQIKEYKPVMKWRLLTEILSDYPVPSRKLGPYMERVGVQLHPNRYIVMSAEFDRKAEIASMRDLHLYAYALCNVAEELINAEGRGAAVEWEDGQCAIILSFDDDDDAKHALRASAVADMLKNFVEEHFKRTVSIGIGREVFEMRDIHVSRKQSAEALKYKLVMGRNTIIAADEIQSGGSGGFHRLFAAADGMIDSIKLPDADKLRVQLRNWFEALASSNAPPDTIKRLVVQLLMKAAIVAEEIGVAEEELMPAHNVFDTLEAFESLEQIRDFAMEVLSGFIDRIGARRSGREKNATVEKVMLFIQRHYMRADLSLNYLSDQFHLSVSHLSKMFKDYTGSNFIDYLMEIRIGKSKELLAGGNGKIRDIAEAVGYTNVNSFTRIFKKMTGLTPTEYRERELANRADRA